MQAMSEQVLTSVDYQEMMTESRLERETVAQSCLLQARRLPEARSKKQEARED